MFRFVLLMSRPRKRESFVLDFPTLLKRDVVGACWLFAGEQLLWLDS